MYNDNKSECKFEIKKKGNLLSGLQGALVGALGGTAVGGVVGVGMNELREFKII